MKATVYKIKNLTNNDCYIGSTSNYSRRKKRHLKDLEDNKHHSIILQRAIVKYGIESFEFEILETFDYTSKEDILVREQIYLDLLPKYNICLIAGSQLGAKRSDAFKLAMSIRMKGCTPWNKGLKTGPVSSKTRKKQRDSRKGARHSKEAKAKIGVKMSKPILQFDKVGVFMKEWKSAIEISKSIGGSYTGLVRHINNKNKYKTFKNFVWKKK